MLKWSAVLFLVLFAAANSVALTEEELNQMPPEKAKNLPVVDVWSDITKAKGGEKVMWLLVENCLIDLRYYFRKPTGVFSDELKSAIREFQTDIGQQPTGNLLMGEFEELNKRHNKITPMEVYPGSSKSVIRSGDTIFATGTWIFEGGKIADPVQTTEIVCQRASRICSMATVRLSMPENTAFGSSAYIYLDTDDFSITKWTESEVVSENESSKCVAYTLVINTKKKEASMFRRAKDKGCAGIAESPQIMKLVEGFQPVFEYWRDRNHKINEMRSSSFQREMKALFDDAEKKP